METKHRSSTDNFDAFALFAGIGLGILGVALLVPGSRMRVKRFVDYALPELKHLKPMDILQVATSVAASEVDKKPKHHTTHHTTHKTHPRRNGHKHAKATRG